MDWHKINKSINKTTEIVLSVIKCAQCTTTSICKREKALALRTRVRAVACTWLAPMKSTRRSPPRTTSWASPAQMTAVPPNGAIRVLKIYRVTRALSDIQQMPWVTQSEITAITLRRASSSPS